jgi:adenosylhomocysteinase
MTLEQFFNTPDYLAEKDQDLFILQDVIERMADEKPLLGVRVVFGHLIVMNAMAIAEALWRGGAEIFPTSLYHNPSMDPLCAELAEYGLPVLPIEEAVQKGDVFLDIAGALGQLRTPKAAVEVTRTGELFYQDIPCPVISIDRARIKHFEDFMGTGESFQRGWQQLRPDDPLEGKRVVQFGYGKVGRGVAFHNRRAGIEVTVVDISETALQRAAAEGFAVIAAAPTKALQNALASADIVLGVTGVPGAVGEIAPVEWLRANDPVLTVMGYDEFGPEIPESEILGGRMPINFCLTRPTLNRYMDPTLTAQALAIEELFKHPERYPPGIHPLPEEIDRWLLESWHALWPDEDLTGVEAELGIE